VENWRSEWYKETTIRWRTSKDDDKEGWCPDLWIDTHLL
jgi:hypothetical protein